MTTRDRIVVMVIVMAAILGGFWFLVIAPKRKTSADLTAAIAVQQQRLTAAQTSAGRAQAAKVRYDADYAAVARLGQAVPADDDVPSLVYQLDHAATAQKIDFRSLELTQGGTSTPPPAAAAPAPTPTTPSGSGGSTGSSTGTGSPPASGMTPAAGTAAATSAVNPAPATQAVAATLPPGAAVGAAGFPTMPFTFIFDGSFFSMEAFLHQINGFTEVGGGAVKVHGRLLTVNSFQLTAGRRGFPYVSATVNATAYVLPAGEGLTAGATPTGPASTPTATPASGTSSSSTPTAPATAALTSGGSR
jgi:hypothetical protein